jgi:hypothetical protein
MKNVPASIAELNERLTREKRDEVVAKCDDLSASNAGASVQLQEKK